MTKKNKVTIVTTIITMIGAVILGYFKYSSGSEPNINTSTNDVVSTNRTNESVVIGKVDKNSKVEVEYVGRDKIDKSNNIGTVDNSVNIQHNKTIVNAAKVFTEKEKKEILSALLERNILLGQENIKCVVLTPNGAFSGSSDLVKDLTLFLMKNGFTINENTNTIIDNSYSERYFIKDMPKGHCHWLIISDI